MKVLVIDIISVFLVIYLFRIVILTGFFKKLDINKNYALVPFYGTIKLCEICSKKIYGVLYFLFGYLFLFSGFVWIDSYVQMQNIVRLGEDAFSRIYGSMIPYHYLFYGATVILILSIIGTSIMRFKICNDTQKSFGRPSEWKWIMFFIPFVGYFKIAYSSFSFFGNPYEEGFIDFSDQTVF